MLYSYLFNRLANWS